MTPAAWEAMATETRLLKDAALVIALETREVAPPPERVAEVESGCRG